MTWTAFAILAMFFKLLVKIFHSVKLSPPPSWCQIARGVKLSFPTSWCQIVLFCMMVSNCPRCQIVLGVKLSSLPSWCQIVLLALMVSNCPKCQIVLGVNLSQDLIRIIRTFFQSKQSGRTLNLLVEFFSNGRSSSHRTLMYPVSLVPDTEN